MTESHQDLPRDQINELAGRASVDPRTLLKVLHGKPVRSTSAAARARRVLIAEGLLVITCNGEPLAAGTWGVGAWGEQPKEQVR